MDVAPAPDSAKLSTATPDVTVIILPSTASYPLNCNFLIDGVQNPASQVTYTESRFGRPSDDPSARGFECEISREALRRAVGDKFDEFTREMKADAEQYGDEDTFQELHDLGYPSFDEIVIAAPERLRNILLEDVYFPLLEGLFGDNDVASCSHAIYMLTDLVIGPESVVLSGRVRRIRAIRR